MLKQSNQRKSTKKFNKGVEKHRKSLTKGQTDSSIINRESMSVKEFSDRLRKHNEDYMVVILGKKAQHNIDMFRVVDTAEQVVIADITYNGDLKLNNDYKDNHMMMNLIISFFSTNAKVEDTYSY